ncbi:MAG: M20/M25/M40 family metallo-hydrolase [Myxococcota bacterium]|nr:M20/M25/M40 family metallo-hydrolase [Myxococcota bacterium]
MRCLSLLVIVAACGGEKKPAKKHFEDAAVPADARRVSGDAERDKLFLSVPTAKAVEGVIERLSAKPHVAGTKANEDVAKEIMRTLGRMNWKLGTQQYDVYLPHPKKLSLRADGVDVSVSETATDDIVLHNWNAYSASGSAKGAVVEDLAAAKGKIALLPYGPLYRGAQVAQAERAGAAAVIFYPDLKAEPERPRDSVQRGTVLYYWQRPGDPLTPGVPSLPGVPRKKPSEVDVLPKIPVMNVSATTADKLRGAKSVELAIEMDTETRPIRNIVAILEGKSKEAVILGNHFDAWGPGAVDPHSGTATMIEIARGLTALTQSGWRPRRTIILAFWDAEEPGIIGSTEWVEENAEQLKSAVAYFNIDSIKTGELVVQGNPALYEHIRSCSADVIDPISGKPFEPKFMDVGIGSDFTPFVHHAGVASLQWATGAGLGKYNVWHSMLDDFAHVTTAHPAFTFIPAYAGLMGLCAIRLADAEYLPLDYVATANWIAAALDAIGVKAGAKLNAAVAKLHEAGMRANSMSRKAGGDPAKCNAALIAAERGFLDPDGIVGRPWYRHLATGPDPVNGYAPLLLPELAAAKNERAMTSASDRLAAAIERVAAALEPCR